MNLTAEQKQALEHGQTVSMMVDQMPCVLVRADVYQRIAALLDVGEYEPSQGYEAFRQAAGDEWDDPALDVYEQYRKRP